MAKRRRRDTEGADDSGFDLAISLMNQKREQAQEKALQGNGMPPTDVTGAAWQNTAPPPYPNNGPIVAQQSVGFAPPFSAPAQNTEQIFPMESTPDENGELLVGMSTIIGKRSSQQDAIATSQPLVYNHINGTWLGVLCDGMGGMNGGEMASSIAVEQSLAKFNEVKDSAEFDVPTFYRNLIASIDYDVASLEDANGRLLGAGTTFVSVMARGGNLYWASVGDSHIYIIRNDQIKMVVEEHNYLRDLLAMVGRGEITLDEAYADKSKDALTSYIGMGGVALMDISSAFAVKPGDVALLCSDGLYRTLSDEEIHGIVLNNYSNMQAAAEALTNYVIMKNSPYQDNTSVVLLKYQ